MYHTWQQVTKDLLIYDQDEQNAWQYMTALRGSDNEDGILKDMITALIRGDTYNSGSIGMPQSNTDVKWVATKLHEEYARTPPSCHYLDHARWGLGALQKWYARHSNQPDKEKIVYLLEKYGQCINQLSYRGNIETFQAFAECFDTISKMWVEA